MPQQDDLPGQAEARGVLRDRPQQSLQASEQSGPIPGASLTVQTYSKRNLQLWSPQQIWRDSLGNKMVLRL